MSHPDVNKFAQSDFYDLTSHRKDSWEPVIITEKYSQLNRICRSFFKFIFETFIHIPTYFIREGRRRKLLQIREDPSIHLTKPYF